MEIVILSLGIPFNRSTLASDGLGGSESAAYYQAMELGRRGHKVKVFTSHTESEPEFIDNVQFISAGQQSQQSPLGYRFEHYARNTAHDVLIVQRVPGAFHGSFAAKVCIHQHHDLALSRYAAQMLAGAWQVAAFTAVSEWHRQQMLGVYGLNPDTLHVVQNGVDPALYERAESPWSNLMTDPYPEDAGVFRLVYQSRPERGLEYLVRPGGIMDRVRDLPVKLYVFGYENTTQQMAPYYDQLRAWSDALPNVVRMGAKSKAELARYQVFSDLLIYPSEFEEVSCITAMEAMHAGLPMLATRCGALPETCEGAGVDFIDLKDGKADEDAFIERLREYFANGQSDALSDNAERQLEAAKTRTWSAAVDGLEAVMAKLFAASTGAVLRTAIERSDIRFAQHILATAPAGDVVVESARAEITHHFSFLSSDEAYAAHYLKHQTRYYDDHEANVIGEDVSGTTRFRGVAMLMQQKVANDAERKLRVLDYGCAHGHYTIPLAKAWPHCDFTGMDVSIRAVQAFTKWAQRDGVSNAVAVQGIAPPHDVTYDVILAGEVLEHVRDPYSLLEKFRASLAPDGLLIITVPTGRWEHSGTVEFRSAREHVEHFDRADIEEIFAGHAVQIFSAPASSDRSGFPLGSYVVGIRFADGTGIGRPDYERKLATYAPRESISACMIVKDGEQTLQRAIESVIDWVDEVRVAVDPATTDGTLSVIARLAARFPFKPIVVWQATKSVLVDGFDAARNESIAGAAGDWILWFDADEEVRRPWNLHKLARPSMHNGFGFKQVHYACDPAQVISTDMPCRFFRNHQGVKFYGVVHEHPEHEIGKAVKFSIVRPEVEFLHNGYVDEETRRARYRRNYPLVLRDREVYPERQLNQFLIMRDWAQGIMFEQEQMGGGVAPHHIDRAEQGVALYESMVRNRSGYIGNRLLIDCLPYYSLCVQILGTGFDAQFSLKHTLDTAPDLGTQAEGSARFHSREFYLAFIGSLLEEATGKYGSKYI